MSLRRSIALLVAVALVVAACSGDDDALGDADQRPSIVVTTNILGDVVGSMVGDLAEVVTIMEVGTNPHEFQPSARQIDAMTNADALVVNGAGFEEGLADAIAAAERDGTPTYAAISAVSTLHGRGHGDEDGHGHDGDGPEPHFFTDPSRMADAAQGIAAFLAETVAGLDTDAFHDRVDAYVAELERLDAEVEEALDAVPDDRRVLVTNHDVFGYFAERYGFEIVGAVIPGSSTAGGTGAGDIAELAGIIEDAEVPAIFTETSSPAELAETLAAEVGHHVEIVELFTESLGDADSDGATYPAMMRTNARRIAEALR